MGRKNKPSETEQLNQKLGDALRMPIVQQEEPPKGNTEFAIDKEKGKK